MFPLTTSFTSFFYKDWAGPEVITSHSVSKQNLTKRKSNCPNADAEPEYAPVGAELSPRTFEVKAGVGWATEGQTQRDSSLGTWNASPCSTTNFANSPRQSYPCEVAMVTRLGREHTTGLLCFLSHHLEGTAVNFLYWFPKLGVKFHL